MAKIVLLLCLISLLACTTGQRITTINLQGIEYYISRMNPYNGKFNYFLAYQFCRTLGLQLVSFETKEKAEAMKQYLTNAGYTKYDFWTSGNRLGTETFIWMSTGQRFNVTFNLFQNQDDAEKSGLLEPVDQNNITSPQRTARDSSYQNSCISLSQPNLNWESDNCLIPKDFICEQTRCFYYNYASIPVSPAQGRPITMTTTPQPSTAIKFTSSTTSTTPLPLMMSSSSSSSSYGEKNQSPESVPQPSFASLKLDHERELERAEQTQQNQNDDINDDDNKESLIIDEPEHLIINNNENVNDGDNNDQHNDDEQHNRELNQVKKQIIKLAKDEIEREHVVVANDNDDKIHNISNDQQIENYKPENEIISELGKETDKNTSTDILESNDDHHNLSNDNNNEETNAQSEAELKVVSDSETDDDDLINNSSAIETDDKHSFEESQNSSPSDIPSVEMRLKQISQEIEKIASGESHVENNNNHQHHHHLINNNDGDDLGRQSFLSLTDLIRTLRPNDKQIIPQIDSDYSNAMRVLGETSSLVGSSDESRKYKETDFAQQQLHQLNRALF